MNKVHNLFFCMSLIISASAFSMDFNSMLQGHDKDENTTKREKKGQSHLGISRDDLDEQIPILYLEACKEGNIPKINGFLQTDPTLLSEAKNENGETALQVAINNNQLAVVKALYPLHSEEEKNSFNEWLKQKSSSNKKLKTLLEVLNPKNTNGNSRPSSITRATSFLRKRRSDL